MPSRVKLSHRPDTGHKVALTTTAEEDPERLPPKFSLRYLHPDYCISRCTKDEKAAFADKMRLLSQMTWSQIRKSGRHGAGYEKISRDGIRAGIPAVVTEDMNIIAFRFFGLKPMVGFRSKDGTFHVVWFDRESCLYRH